MSQSGESYLTWDGHIPSGNPVILAANLPDLLGLTIFSNPDFVLTIHPNHRVCSLELSAAEYDDWFLGNQSSTDVRTMTSRLYTVFDDLFDFVFFINNADVNPGGYSGRHYGVKNDIEGIGSSLFDNTSLYGSDGQLQSVLHLRTLSNLRGGPSLHEIMHRWANRLDDIPNSGAHWGFSSVGGQLGGWAPGTLTFLGGNSYDADGVNGGSGFGTIANGGNGVPFSPLELYLMGLTSTTTVEALQVAENASFYRFCDWDLHIVWYQRGLHRRHRHKRRPTRACGRGISNCISWDRGRSDGRSPNQGTMGCFRQ